MLGRRLTRREEQAGPKTKGEGGRGHAVRHENLFVRKSPELYDGSLRVSRNLRFLILDFRFVLRPSAYSKIANLKSKSKITNSWPR
jgi:hypothetical protein